MLEAPQGINNGIINLVSIEERQLVFGPRLSLMSREHCNMPDVEVILVIVPVSRMVLPNGKTVQLRCSDFSCFVASPTSIAIGILVDAVNESNSLRFTLVTVVETVKTTIFR